VEISALILDKSRERYEVQFARKILHGDTNKEFSKSTTPTCNQEDKKNSEYENFDTVNAASNFILLQRKETPTTNLFTVLERQNYLGPSYV
jgi:hypothetical protein